jgi:hypothetical protein
VVPALADDPPFPVVPAEDPPGPFPPSPLQPTPTAMHSAKKPRRHGELENGLVCDMDGFLLIETIKESILGDSVLFFSSSRREAPE